MDVRLRGASPIERRLTFVFRRPYPHLGYGKAVWAIAHGLCRFIWKLLHEGVHYVESGPAPSPITLARGSQYT
jgi:hypothetical protein